MKFNFDKCINDILNESLFDDEDIDLINDESSIYDKWVEYYQKMFRKFKLSPKIVLDFGCGTGSVRRRVRL